MSSNAEYVIITDDNEGSKEDLKLKEELSTWKVVWDYRMDDRVAVAPAWVYLRAPAWAQVRQFPLALGRYDGLRG